MSYGGLFQLVAFGAQDTYLSGNPKITFFNVIYRTTSNLSPVANNIIREPEYIQNLKLLIDQNDINAMLELATIYENEIRYKLMKKYYLLYINNVDKHELEKIINKFKIKKNIKQFAKLYDTGATILNLGINEDCPICFFENPHYKTQCCGKYLHSICLISCKVCPLCRNRNF